MDTTERLNTITLREAAEGLYRWKAYESYRLGLPFDASIWRPSTTDMDRAAAAERTWNATEWLAGTGSADFAGVYRALRSLGYTVPAERHATIDLSAPTTIDIRDGAAINL